ncbi:hypothetical protein [Fusibacillus kribbianus]|uniref:DUF8052 domain-containing protein n=1 Tax=Fusibacillus kribbianus TaxID=3044208 RepID=A0AAP4EWN6_9FIRM|nr:hypothetical protein [Ruminococcus sp. YH-rum2234]MDI9241674.1 hypothetical protein [Ruminococcus sp. YH-rum2234]
MIDANSLFKRLLTYYSNDYDVIRPYQLDDTIYDAYAAYSHFNCFEHAFIRSTLTLSKRDILRFRDQVTTIIEPWMVCAGESSPPQNHIYTYVTGVFISEKRIRDDVRRIIRRFRYYRGYGYYKSGYCQARIAAFDMETGSLIVSPAAKELMLEYQRVL